MLSDSEARIRRRAALAIGRVGLADGVAPLPGILNDPDPEVRQMAAFAPACSAMRARAIRWIAALGDPSPLMQAQRG
jgi:HEAT repeat protein